MTKIKVKSEDDCKEKGCYMEEAMHDCYKAAKKGMTAFDTTDDIKKGQFGLSAYRVMLSAIRTNRSVNKNLIRYMP